VCEICFGDRTYPSSSEGFGARKIRSSRGLFGSDVKWMVVA
jgi:hypothetical protein